MNRPHSRHVRSSRRDFLKTSTAAAAAGAVTDALSHPLSANGMGGRQVRVGKDYGEIFDHHFNEFDYADGSQVFSQCRQIPGC
jgi:hypothetical protein